MAGTTRGGGAWPHPGAHGFSTLTADQAHSVLRPFTGAVTDTTAEAVAPPLTALADPFTLALQRAESQANDLLDEILSAGNKPLIARIDLQLRNREVATEADVQALVEEIRERLLERVRQATGCGCCDRGGDDMSMTTDAKNALATTIRSLRARLIEDLHAATQTAYRLSVHSRDAGLDEVARTRRRRLEAWMAEQVRAQGATGIRGNRSADDFRREAEKQAAYTLLNRLVLLRLLEGPSPSGQPLREPAVVSGGWESRAYLDFRQLAPGIVRDDETEGYAFLLRLVFEDLATELPGLYGPAGVADLVPVPAATLRHVIDALNSEALTSCWADDMTLGWVYQYWNDPEREALDDKLNGGGKVEPHEIASKTQMFTERYMVDWLLQNSLGPMWLAICQRHGWTPEATADGTLDRLEARRADWRARRGSGEVTLTDLMPLHTDAERRWAYYVPQPVPESAVAQAPETIRDLKLLDPAVGSGHFLVVALDLLAALYREEARHRGETEAERWSDRAIVERILSHNLHGIDLDPRAMQIAAAALWLKAQQMAPEPGPSS